MTDNSQNDEETSQSGESPGAGDAGSSGKKKSFWDRLEPFLVQLGLLYPPDLDDDLDGGPDGTRGAQQYNQALLNIGSDETPDQNPATFQKFPKKDEVIIPGFPGHEPEEPSPSQPSYFVFGEMSGAVFFVWLPVALAFFLPWSEWFGDATVMGKMPAALLVVAVVIAIPPWIVLLVHLLKGRLSDGILDMFLWAIWECAAMIALCILYPERAEMVIWNATGYWEDMLGWLVTGSGAEGDPSRWVPIHAMHLGFVSVAGFIFGLPALIMGVLQLNYMNFYVAKCMLLSDQPLAALAVGWHFWSVMRVAGYIILASTFFQLLIKLLFRVQVNSRVIITLLWCGLALVVADGLFKWLVAEDLRLVLRALCGF